MTGDLVRLPLHAFAHGRTGDKGDRSNISVIAYEDAVYPLLVEQVTPARVEELFLSRRPTSVVRYLLPKLAAMNFVIDGVLDGGVNGSLNLDTHGKALAFLLLQLRIAVPVELVQYARAPHRIRQLINEEVIR